MKIVNNEISRLVDKYCIEKLQIPGILLMENAAISVINNIDLNSNDVFTVVCGTGNNGGDGFAIARHLILRGKKVNVFILGNIKKLSYDCKINFNYINKLGIKVHNISCKEDIESLRNLLLLSNITIDSIFGTGLSRKIEGIYEETIKCINNNSKYIIAIDVPSGLDSNSGEVLGTCIKANKTITFQFYKVGFLNYNSLNYTGKILTTNIGIPSIVEQEFKISDTMLKVKTIKDKIKTRDKFLHKGNCGKVLIVAGSKEFTGAAYITTQSAVRSGAGLITLACNKENRDVLSNKLTEAMTIERENKELFLDKIRKSDAIGFGPGIGVTKESLDLLDMVLNNSNVPIVIDADGLNILKTRLDRIRKLNLDIIITPHVGEMSRLTGLDIDYINNNRINVAKNFAMKYKVIVLLKGFNSVITDGKRVFINSTGDSAMASGGMGDCLTGIITSFIAQGYNLIEAAYISAFIHGYCGDELSKNMYCVSATQVMDKIPTIIKKLQNN